MSLDSELKDIFSLLGKFLSTLGIKTSPIVKHRHKPIAAQSAGKFESPLHGSWVNLGDFIPGVYINDTHKNGHYGIDMQAPAGTPVYAFSSGKVLSAGQNPGNTAGGITVSILHSKNMMTYYAHLSSVSVNKGDVVDTSTKIGSVGNTGNAQHTPAHLHFEIHNGVDFKNPNSNWNGTAVNPANYISTPPYGKKQQRKRQV